MSPKVKDTSAITKTYVLTFHGPNAIRVLRKIDRLMAWLHTSSSWGHTGVVAVALDGDGNEKCRIEGVSDDSVEYIKRHGGRTREMRVEYLNLDDRLPV